MCWSKHVQRCDQKNLCESLSIASISNYMKCSMLDPQLVLKGLTNKPGEDVVLKAQHD